MSAAGIFDDALQGNRAKLVALLMFLFPAMALLVDSAATTALLVLAFFGIGVSLLDKQQTLLSRDEKLLFFTVVFFFAVAVLAYFAGEINYLGFRKLGRYLRFLLLIPIYLVVRRMPASEGVWWSGLAVGAAASGLYAVLVRFLGVDFGTEIGKFTQVADPTQFSDLSLVMGVMCLGGMNYFYSRQRLFVMVPVLCGLLGIAASLLSGAMGGWLAMPLLAILFVWFIGLRAGRKAAAITVMALLLLFVAVYLIEATEMAQRLRSFWVSLERSLGSSTDQGPVGMRLTLWEVAMSGFLQHPVLGLGVGGYADHLRTWVEAGRIDEWFLRFNHPHNEYFSVAASRGLFGFLSLGLLFGVPLKHFLWGARHADGRIANLSFAGVVLILGYLHFAISESIFDRTLPITFYVFCLSVIYGLVRANERQYLSRPAVRKKTLSVIIIAKNETDRIRATLESVHGWADEIILLDSGSTDGTPDVAREYTDKVWETDWPGFGAQKQRALDKASCEWVLSIDADEIVSNELRNEIDNQLIEQPAANGYRIPRPLIIFGKHVDYGGSWQAPVRLFQRDIARFDNAPVHEKVELSQGKIGMLRCGLLHPTYRDYYHAMQKFSEYAWLQANARWRRGSRSGMLSAALRGFYNFVYNYFLRFGFLDGAHGLALAMLHAQYTYSKYAALWAIRQESRPE